MHIAHTIAQRWGRIPWRHRIAASAILFAAGAGAGVLTLSQASDLPGESSVHSWQERIRAEGSDTAYDTFVRTFADASPYRAHQAAHDFGAALYATEGLAGITACGTEFVYGCFHEFVGTAIAEHGLAVIETLRARCGEATRAVTCEHGIGHGIQTHIGYTREDLAQALSVCDRYVPGSDPVGGCYGGVFMEYNLRTMLSKSAHRPFDGAVREPCDTVAEPYRDACIFQQPKWWRYAILDGAEGVNAVAQLAEQCNVFDDMQQRVCIQGVGNMAAFDVQFSIHDARTACANIPDAEHELVCRLQAFVSTGLAVGIAPGDAERMCQSLPEAVHEECRQKTAALMRELETSGPSPE